MVSGVDQSVLIMGSDRFVVCDARMGVANRAVLCPYYGYGRIMYSKLSVGNEVCVEPLALCASGLEQLRQGQQHMAQELGDAEKLSE